MRTILLVGTLAHLALVFVLLDGNGYGGTWLWAFGAALALAGMVTPFFINTRREQRWANLFPGVLLVTGWGSWLLTTEDPMTINIWGIIGPVLGVSFLAGLLAISMLLGPRRTRLPAALPGLEHEETLPPGETGNGRASW